MNRIEKTHLPVAALTHPGMKGKNNEDRFGVTAFRSQDQPNVPVLLAVLSDGIGGNRAGEVASEMVVNLISQHVANSEGRNPQATLESAIHFASDSIFQQAQKTPEQHGMGATCACAWIAGDRLFTATVGDSRIYLMRGETIQQLSTDHTWIQEALERGLIQPDETNGHPNAHVIRRYVGSPTPPEVDFRIRLGAIEASAGAPNGQGVKLLPGDCLLLCSDGLTDLVGDEEILKVFQQTTLAEGGRQLIDTANQRGGHDNITLIAIQIPGGATSAAPVAPAPAAVRTRTVLTGCLGVIALAVLVGVLAGGSLLFTDSQATATATPTNALALTVTATRTPAPTRTVDHATATTASPISTATPTLVRPTNGGPTVTAWPTNTPVGFRPSSTPTP